MKRRVCVVGAGPGGLCVARRLADQFGTQIELTIFEQCDQIGGIWLYTDDDRPDADFPHAQNAEDSFPSSEVIFNYLQRFAKPIRHFVQLEKRISLIEHVKSANSSCWRVEIEDLKKDQKIIVRHFDAIFICSGHHWRGFLPEFVPKLRLKWVHSHCYRRAENYKGMRVAVVGGQLSGAEIALQLVDYAEKVYLCSPNKMAEIENLCPNLEVFGRVIDAEENRLILEDGKVISQIDLVIFCTGYRFSFPFFEKSENFSISWDPFVSPLFGHVVHPEYVNSLFFIGLNNYQLPFYSIEVQTRFSIALLVDKILNVQQIISLEKVKHYEKRRIQ
uniref:Flavin-containing monooxygenase n=1 Tax=Globodera pallida TaxID=36090 RepID=A0A183BLE2_GLOPA